MPSSQLDFRGKCGSFLPIFQNFMLKRALLKNAMRISTVTVRSRSTGALFGLVLILMFWGDNLFKCRGGNILLLRCGDVEANPGPNPDPSTSTSSGSMRQTRLSASNPSRSVKEPSLSEVVSMLHNLETSLNSKMDGMKEEMKQMRQEFSTLSELVSGVKEEVNELRQKNDALELRNNELEAKVNILEKKCDDLENRSKRNNLIFYGLDRKQGETNEECERMIQDLISEKLELTDSVEFDRVHRLGSKTDAPVIARCTFYRQKVKILKAKQKLKGTNVFVGEDFSQGVRDTRRKLAPHLKKAKSDGKQAHMVYDHLVIDGKRFGLSDRDLLQEMK